jgi:hypothetical protein
MTEVKDNKLLRDVKLCCRCGETKQISLFTVNNANKSKVAAHCKICDARGNKTHKLKNRETILERGRKYALKRSVLFSVRIRALVYSARQRAKLKNREHTITYEDVLSMWPIDSLCPVFGFKLEFNSKGFRETSPSIDRIDSSKGYTLDNIQIISWKANRLKTFATVEDLESVVSFMRKRNPT